MIEVGDHVYVGEGKVHWVVENIWPLGDYQVYNLRSGLSGRRTAEVIGPNTRQLKLHSKGRTA